MYAVGALNNPGMCHMRNAPSIGSGVTTGCEHS